MPFSAEYTLFSCHLGRWCIVFWFVVVRVDVSPVKFLIRNLCFFLTNSSAIWLYQLTNFLFVKLLQTLQTVHIWQEGGNYNCIHTLKDHTAEVSIYLISLLYWSLFHFFTGEHLQQLKSKLHWSSSVCTKPRNKFAIFFFLKYSIEVYSCALVLEVGRWILMN